MSKATISKILGDKNADDIERVIWRLTAEDADVSRDNAIDTIIYALKKSALTPERNPLQLELDL